MRSGFVAGDADALQKFLLYRTYHGTAMSVAVQHASIAAWKDEAHVVENRRLYAQKFASSHAGHRLPASVFDAGRGVLSVGSYADQRYRVRAAPVRGQECDGAAGQLSVARYEWRQSRQWLCQDCTRRFTRRSRRRRRAHRVTSHFESSE